MGEIYLAWDERLERQVALKVVRVSTLTEEKNAISIPLQHRFQHEARAISMLDHPHILPLFDYGQVMLGDEQLIYLVMPHHAEGSLESWFHKHHALKPLPPSLVSLILNQAADALQYAHDHHIIHQDVKASNFLVRSNRVIPEVPHLLLADFGLARLSNSTDTSRKHTHGTPLYMAPEQWHGETLPASDQYSLAIMAYRLLTGQYPFQGSEADIRSHHLQTPPPVASALNPLVSTQLATIVQRGMAKRPEERYPSIVTFAQTFYKVLSSEQELPALVQEHAPSQSSVDIPAQHVSPQSASNSLSLSHDISSNIDTPTSDSASLSEAKTSGSGASTPASSDAIPILDEQSTSSFQRKPHQQTVLLTRPEEHSKPGASPFPALKGPSGKPRKGRRWGFLVVLVLLPVFACIGSLMFTIPAGRDVSHTVHSQKTSTSGTPHVTPSPQSRQGAPVIAHNTPVGTSVATARPGAPTSPPSAPTITPTPVPSVEFLVQSITITFDPDVASTLCGGIVNEAYIATITDAPNSPGGTVFFQYSSDNGQTYNNASLAFAPGESSRSYRFSRQLVISLQLLGIISLDIAHTGIVTTTSPNVVTQKATPSISCY